ncbi:hypothetical protein [Sulfurospirillum deleyianum]|uniref:Type II secretion system protein n=1 Tax=Sulfurospirillum deleyianum (strain ATCC 51133 / DSM 6946 / 5175) TaxID=525898 RepID=D1AZK8_SULD5|nr:hypothetical protein [Sulfurospirillum deleyianum]ACZ11475.1 conserved hypothetical protein [Sulfurospirillum deleyianum DSM 6946]
MHRQAILNQLGYSVSENTIAQLERVIANTSGFEHVEKHLMALHDALKPFHSFVALSSNKDYFKIKNEAGDATRVDEVNEMIVKWAEKYKITLEKVPNKNTYYVIGYKL